MIYTNCVVSCARGAGWGLSWVAGAGWGRFMFRCARVWMSAGVCAVGRSRRLTRPAIDPGEIRADALRELGASPGTRPARRSPPCRSGQSRRGERFGRRLVDWPMTTRLAGAGVGARAGRSTIGGSTAVRQFKSFPGDGHGPKSSHSSFRLAIGSDSFLRGKRNGALPTSMKLSWQVQALN